VSSLTRAGLLGALVFAAAALTGCGGSSSHAEQKKDVTVPAYGVFPATTESVSPASERACKQNAEGFADNAVQFLAHSGPEAAYPADLYYVIMRGAITNFQAQRCETALLGNALVRRLTAKQRRVFVAALPRAMARVVRQGLSDARS